MGHNFAIPASCSECLSNLSAAEVNKQSDEDKVKLEERRKARRKVTKSAKAK